MLKSWQNIVIEKYLLTLNHLETVRKLTKVKNNFIVVLLWSLLHQFSYSKLRLKMICSEAQSYTLLYKLKSKVVWNKIKWYHLIIEKEIMIKIIIVLNKIKKNMIFDVFYKLKKHLIWNYNNYYNKIKKDNTMIYPKKIFHYIYKMKLYQIILIICHIQMK